MNGNTLVQMAYLIEENDDAPINKKHIEMFDGTEPTEFEYYADRFVIKTEEGMSWLYDMSRYTKLSLADYLNDNQDAIIKLLYQGKKVIIDYDDNFDLRMRGE